MAQPRRMTCCFVSASESAVRKPGMASSLSSVPPVCPSPRPDIIGTATPHAATSGASTRDTLSPTPPVECLSMRGTGQRSKLRRSPEVSMASVKAPPSRLRSMRGTTNIYGPLRLRESPMRALRCLPIFVLAALPLAAQTAAEHIARGDSAQPFLHPDVALRHYQAALALDSLSF